MPVTSTEWPILTAFFCLVRSRTHTADQMATRDERRDAIAGDNTPKQIPKGVVLGKDGKPCRSCTSFANWAQMTKAQTSTSTSKSTSTTTTTPSASLAALTSTAQPPAHCPPDVEVLGRSTWTMLHTLTANYPDRPTLEQQRQTHSFLSLFSNIYPCSHCADDFRAWLTRPGNAPRVSSRAEFGAWMCEAHNAVNEKLGKEVFDCGRWEERWVTGPSDGSCG